MKGSLEKIIREKNQWISELEETRPAKWNNPLLTGKLPPNFSNLSLQVKEDTYVILPSNRFINQVIFKEESSHWWTGLR